jgi:integrase
MATRKGRTGLRLTQNLKKSRMWYIRGTVSWWKNGQQYSEQIDRSTKTDSEEAARGILRQIELEVLERNTTGKDPSITFGMAAADYLKNGGDDRFLDLPLDYFEHLPLDEITQQLLDEKARVAYPKAAAATLRRNWHTPIIAVIKHHNPALSFRRPTGGKSRTVFFRPKEAERVLAALKTSRWPNPWSPALFEFWLATGARSGETFAIDARNDVFLDYGFVVLRDTKNGSERRVTLNERAKATLSGLPNIDRPGPLFRRYDGKPYTPRKNRGGQFNKAFATAVKEAGLDPKKFTPHICRHTWATWFYATTLDILRLQALGGWASTDMVQRYVKLASPVLATEVQQAGWSFADQYQNSAIMGVVRS